VGINPVSR